MSSDKRKNPDPQSFNKNSFQNSYQNSSGPLFVSYNDRKKTNLICTFAYIALSTIVMSAFFTAYVLERDSNIFLPIDPDGRKCGRDAAIGYSLIYFPTPFPQTIDRAVCVKQCPTSSQQSVNCLKNSKVQSCTFDITDHFNHTNQFIVYPTTQNSFFSLCQPSSKIIFDAINSKINTYQLFKNFSNIYESLYIIIGVCPFVSILMVIIYVFLITQSQNVTVLLKGMIFCFVLSLVLFSVYSFTTSAKRIFYYMPYLGIAVFVLALCFTAYFIYYREFIDSSLRLLNMGVKYIKQNRSLIFMSLGLFLIWIIIFVLQIIALIFIYSINSGQVTPGTQISFAYFAGIQNTTIVNILLILTIIHFIWTNLILYHCGEYVCMAAGSFWVLQIQTNFKNALFTLLRFHLGTVIYGSLANTILGLLSGLLYLIMPQSNGKCCFCFKCSKLLNFYHSQTFNNYIGIYNDLNYIEVALKGKDYIQAGRSLSQLLFNYVRYISRAYRVARTVVFISKILVALFTTVICYIVILLDPNTKSDFLINIIIFIFSSILISFAFQSYNRSFQVILLTILMKYYESQSMAQKILIDNTKEQFDNPQIALEKQVMRWFQGQKALQKRGDQNSGQTQN